MLRWRKWGKEHLISAPVKGMGRGQGGGEGTRGFQEEGWFWVECFLLVPQFVLLFFFWVGGGGEGRGSPPFSPHPNVPLSPPRLATVSSFHHPRWGSLRGDRKTSWGMGELWSIRGKNGGKNKCFNKSLVGDCGFWGVCGGGQLSLIVGKEGGERRTNSSISSSEAKPLSSFLCPRPWEGCTLHWGSANACWINDWVQGCCGRRKDRRGEGREKGQEEMRRGNTGCPGSNDNYWHWSITALAESLFLH